jgi:hypothetical protein
MNQKDFVLTLMIIIACMAAYCLFLHLKMEGMKLDKGRRQRVFSGDQVGGNIDIAGRHFKGKNVVIKGNKVFVDGRDVSEYFDEGQIVEIKLTGPLESLTTSANVTCKDVQGNVNANGNVVCGDVRGYVKTDGNVTAKDITGGVKAGGNVIYG